MASFDDFTLNIPCLWEKEWLETISDAEGANRQLLIFQARGANLLKNVNDYKVTPERLAWLSIWSKTFSAIDAALTALDRDSDYLLKILSRVVFEAELHVFTIIEPVLNVYELSKSKYKVTTSEHKAWEQTQEKMCAYTAWGLWNDKQLISELLNPQHLDRAWDPNPVHTIIKDPKERQAYESIHGPLKVETELELLVQRRKQEDHLRKVEHRLQDWLNDQKLKEWFHKLRYSYKQRRKEITFFELLNETEKTIRKKLKNLNFGFSYPAYKEGSMVMHGSTLEQFYHLNKTNLTPLFVMLADDTQSSALFVGSACNSIFGFLYVLQNQLWLSA